MQNISRRAFLKGTLQTSAAAGLAAGLSACAELGGPRPGIRGVNQDVRVAVVGFNSRGKGHISALSKIPGVRIVALCDVDSLVLDEQARKLGHPVTRYTDIRKLLDDKGVDAVSIATPNHWHSLMTVWACQAGKDVYVEKPVSHNIFEGQQTIAAARRYGRIVQAGTQCRSSKGLIDAVAWLQAGNLGKIKLVRGLCYKSRPSIGLAGGPQPIPSSIDYDLWCGPAPKGPLLRKKLHYDWHWVWETGNGDLGNQGVHQVDIARWILGESAVSPRVLSFGGRLGYEDDGRTPNTQFIWHDYPTAPLLFEVRGLPTEPLFGVKVGVVAECEGGVLIIPGYEEAFAYDKNWDQIRQWKGGGDHHANWIDAIRTRRSTDLRGPIEEGHISSALCHMANISYRLGISQQPETIWEQVKGNKPAYEAFTRVAEHLDDNSVDLRDTPATLGPSLAMDPATERFFGNGEIDVQANAMLTREYREPYLMPQFV